MNAWEFRSLRGWFKPIVMLGVVSLGTSALAMPPPSDRTISNMPLVGSIKPAARVSPTRPVNYSIHSAASGGFSDAGVGANPGAQCEAPATCETGGCCDLNTGECTTGLTDAECDALAAPSTFLGLGTDCDPNCCAQPASVDTGFSGADNCEDVFVHQITVPDPSETRCNGTGIICTTSAECGGAPCVATKVVITITGDNSTASFPSPNTCLFNTGEDPDPGWWEGIETDDCFMWRIDNCCTDPPHLPQYRVITQDCPWCGGFIVSNDHSRGAPFCDDDNLWSEYGPLEAGTYYFPIFSGSEGTHGQYQLHFTIEACPEPACCFLACDRPNPDSCDDQTPCTVGVCVEDTCRELCSGPDAECDPDACEARCEVMNPLACEALDGVSQGPPNKFPATLACVQNQQACDRVTASSCGTCQLGSCCEGPNACLDRDINGAFTKDECDTAGLPFTPGIKCRGGYCFLSPIRSCAEDDDCDESGPCIGDPDQLTQPSPCPVCETDNLESCRYSPQYDPAFFAGAILNIDRGNNSRIADDFIPVGDTITSICFDPGFLNPNTGEECVAHCDSPVGIGFPDDQWQVTIYDTDPLTGLPGNALGPGTQTLEVQAKLGLGGGFRVCVYSGILPVPVTVTPGECHWLEISGAGPGGDASGCNAYWVNTETGNAFALQDDNGVYGINDAVEFDFVFCVDSGIDNTGPDCGPVEGACCRCPATEGGPARCDDGEFADCVALQGRFDFDVASCPANPDDLCPSSAGANDTCANMDMLTDPDDDDLISVLADNICATDDGPTPIFCEGEEPVLFESDIWYGYVATCTDFLTISTCADNNDFDAVLAVYFDPDNPTVCPCPGDAGFTQFGACSDFDIDECPANTDAFLRLNVIEGNCYTIRLGGYDSQGITDLELNCGVPLRPDPLLAADDGLGGDYNRVGDFKMPASAVAGTQEVAIRVTFNRVYIDSDEDAANGCPVRQGLPDLQSFEGEVRYLGP
ncbi:MAG: hypothetical protein IID38_09925, partial [Planctomycetes bacterium]|nr:hypothetical protein [Planctomycetota bacterium]